MKLLLAFAAAGLAAATAQAAPPKVGDTAPDFTLKTLAGADATLSKLAESGPVVLVQLRGYPGYQCPLCTRQVADFVKKADQFKTAGAQVVFVYPGPAAGLKAHAAEFTAGKDYPAVITFLLDPDYTFVNQYGLRWDAKNETAYPAAFVLDKARKVTFAKVSDSHAGRASAAEVLTAVVGK